MLEYISLDDYQSTDYKSPIRISFIVSIMEELMIIKAFGLGVLSIILGQLVGLILLFTLGAIFEFVAEKIIFKEISIKRFRYLLSYSFFGLGIGIMNTFWAYYFALRSWIPTIIFIVYLVFFVPTNKHYIFNSLCEEDEIVFKGLLRKTEITTFISYIIGFYGLWAILMKI